MKEILLLLAMFWNVENYFDTSDNPSTADEEFTPMGKNHWTRTKFEKKRDDIAKTIILAADSYGMFPGIIGLCEVENRYVLEELVEKTPLARMGYSFIHKESPDSRGIDVALLYRKEVFLPLENKFLKMPFPTREVLYSKGVANGMDTLHIFVNHWPSKSGGEKSSHPRRMAASERVREVTDSILNANPSANIILMGDFNDTPASEPLENLDNFANLALLAQGNEGTHKYRGEWATIDQYLVSGNLLPPSGANDLKWIYCHREMDIFAPDYLLVPDEVYMGVKPSRTLQGPRYLGGVSDHLPIMLKIYGPEY